MFLLYKRVCCDIFAVQPAVIPYLGKQCMYVRTFLGFRYMLDCLISIQYMYGAEACICIFSLIMPRGCEICVNVTRAQHT